MRRLLPLALLSILALPAPVDARDTSIGASPGRVPRKNFSFVHADADWVRIAFVAAAEHATEGEWVPAVRAMQRVIDQVDSKEKTSGRAPYVRAVEGEETYEGAHVVARHTVAKWGDEGITAYESEYGGAARDLLDAAVTQRDIPGIEQVADRYLVTTAGRTAALLRTDIALEASDWDSALEWLEMLEDLEDVSTESEERLAPWRTARIQRHARVLAKDEASVAAVTAALEAAAPGASSLDAVPFGLRRPPPAPTTWPTTGGNRMRNAVPPSVGSALTWKWSVSNFVDIEDPRAGAAEATSPWHPPRAVTTEEHVFVSDGNSVHVLRIDDGKVAALEEFEDGPMLSRDTDEDPRLQLGLLEGHTLSIVDTREIGARAPGHIIYAAVPDGDPWQITADPEQRKIERDDRIQAFHWDGEHMAHLFTAGGMSEDEGFDGKTRLYGAPLVYRGSLWVGAVRPSDATGDRWQVWLFQLDPFTGAMRSRTHIATGTPVRRGRLDEVIPTTCSAANGRVVVGTSVGVVSAVSARDGRVLWAYKYDRESDPERERRNARLPSKGGRLTGFSNEPPILTLDRTIVTPVDGTSVFVLTNRPRGSSRTMRCQQLEREGSVVNMSIEHVAGVTHDTQRLVLVGRGQDADVPGPITAVRDLVSGSRRWEQPGPTLFALQPFGRAMVTDTEVFVSTRGGIAAFDLLKKGADRGVLEVGMLPKDLREEFPVPYGNLVPVPGRGMFAVSATTITFWGAE